MKLSSKEEVKAAIGLLSSSSNMIFDIYGSEVERITLLISVFLAIKELNLSPFVLPFSWVKLQDEFKLYRYSIVKYELDIDEWQKVGNIGGVYLTIEQVYSKLSSISSNDAHWYQIQGVIK